MLSERFSMAFKAFLGLLPVFYGGIIIAVLPSTIQWAIVVAVVLITLFVLVTWMEWPLETVWPLFPGVFLIMAGSLGLYLGAPSLGPISNSVDLVVLYLIGGLYIVWAARATWRAIQV